MPRDNIEQIDDEPREVPSPCIGVCDLDPYLGWCIGCYRTVPEIASWPRLLPAEKRRLIERLELRHEAV